MNQTLNTGQNLFTQKSGEAPDAIVNAIANPIVVPYVSVSVGKETADGSSILSPWGSITVSPNGIFVSLGGDISVSAPALSVTFLSFSAGVTIDRSGRTQKTAPGVLNSDGGLSSLLQGDLTVGAGAGSYVGISTSTTDVPIPYLNTSPTRTYSFGITITTTPAWGSGNIGYTFPLLTW